MSPCSHMDGCYHWVDCLGEDRYSCLSAFLCFSTHREKEAPRVFLDFEVRRGAQV
jgi:hypothetical protein